MYLIENSSDLNLIHSIPNFTQNFSTIYTEHQNEIFIVTSYIYTTKRIFSGNAI